MEIQKGKKIFDIYFIGQILSDRVCRLFKFLLQKHFLFFLFFKIIAQLHSLTLTFHFKRVSLSNIWGKSSTLEE